ncbi:cytochrome P450 [Salinisphaera sp. USBA-960]|nr:cytochrome P450 [Salifodinibacter halophilus]NNC26276.1 cytochrome P450 [Salifodinibacter halophilus]
MLTRVESSKIESAFSIEPDEATRRRLVDWHTTYGPVYRVRRADGDGNQDWVIHQPDAVRDVLARRSGQFTKGRGLDRVKILLGNGIMVSEGDFWTRQQKRMQAAFRPKTLAEFNPMIFDECVAEADRLRDRLDAERYVDIAPHISELILIIVLKAIFGPDYETLVAREDNPFRLLTAEPTRDLSFARRFHALTQQIGQLLARRCDTSATTFDFLGHLANSVVAGVMTEREAIDEVMTLIVAGHETTASALSFAWHLLATHPDATARAQAAADTVDEHRLRATGGGERGQLDWIDHVVAETLRLYPPGWLLSRRALADVDAGGYRISAGEQVYVSPYVLHRDASIWPRPTAFEPSRFERALDRAKRFAYIPFAAGARRCIGEQLARIEMRTHLVTMLRRFTPCAAGDDPPAVDAAINLRPAGAIPIQFALR